MTSNQTPTDKPMRGVRVLEVAAWTFVPSGGAVLADFGAEVIKIEPPTGDPQRALKNILNMADDGPNPFNEVPNRGKRSVTLDLATQAGREALLAIAATSDVFLTSYLPEVRTKLRIDVDDIRAANPSIIYARGSGWGSKGPLRNQGGFDAAAAWAASGVGKRLADGLGGGVAPPGQPPAFFDLQGGNTLAGAIAMALFKRERTGEPSIVDVSLLQSGMWTMSPEIVSAPYMTPMFMDRRSPGNPLTTWYRTGDDRWIMLVLLQADRFWGDLISRLGYPELATDARFADMGARYANREECVRTLDEVFGSMTLAELTDRLDGFDGVWSPFFDVAETHTHPQTEPNGFLPRVTDSDGVEFAIVAAPMQFDEQPTVPSAGAPAQGADTEMVLLEAGMEWDEITALRERGAFG